MGIHWINYCTDLKIQIQSGLVPLALAVKLSMIHVLRPSETYDRLDSQTNVFIQREGNILTVVYKYSSIKVF